MTGTGTEQAGHNTKVPEQPAAALPAGAPSEHHGLQETPVSTFRIGIDDTAGAHDHPGRVAGRIRCRTESQQYRLALYAAADLAVPQDLCEAPADLATDLPTGAAKGDATKPLREPTGKPAETAAEDSNAAIETVAPEAAVDTHNGISEDELFGEKIKDFSRGVKELSTKPDISAERKELEAKLDAATALAKVRKLASCRAALDEAKLKLRLMKDLGEDYLQQAAKQLTEAKYKTQLLEISKLRAASDELQLHIQLREKRTREQQVMTDTIAAVKRWTATVTTYRAALSDPAHPWKYYCHCHEESGLGKWFCDCLAARPGWRRYPSEPWFKTDKQSQMHCPAGNLMVDYCDQSVYSRAESRIGGTELLYNKAQLPQVAQDFMPGNHFIRGGAWDGKAPDATDDTYFVKDMSRNWATGVYVVQGVNSCLEMAEKNVSYVVQSAIKNPKLHDGHKCHARIYFVLLSPKGTKSIELFVYKMGWLVRAHRPFNANSLDKMVQISRDRYCLLNLWPESDVLVPKAHKIIQKIIGRAANRFESSVLKTSFDLFGCDFLLDQAGTPWLLEINRSPLVNEADYGFLHGILNLVFPDSICPGDERHHVEWQHLDMITPEEQTNTNAEIK